MAEKCFTAVIKKSVKS